MNNAQRIVVVIFCFLLGGFLIFGVYMEGTRTWRELWWFFRDIKLYLGIISIGIGIFFLMRGVKHE